MSLQIIIKGKNKYGKTRSEQEENLRKDGHTAMSDENLEKCKWIEKRYGVKEGFTGQHEIEAID